VIGFQSAAVGRTQLLPFALEQRLARDLGVDPVPRPVWYA
jgi:hypothetical protein